MSERRITSRIIHKHDVASNWARATGFIPQQGEIIVYDIDDTHDYERIKIGDGVTNVNALPFANDAVIAYVDTKAGELRTDINDIGRLVGDTSISEQIDTAIADITFPVNSVNGKTGAVELVASDVGAISSDVNVVVAKTTTTASGTDIFKWNTVNMPSSPDWQSIAYGNSMFVAIAWNSAEAAYSADGINWTSTTLPSSKTWKKVIYGGDKFIAYAAGREAAYSTDGITWATMSLSSYSGYTGWSGITYGNGMYVANESYGKSIAYSSDGINWTSITNAMPMSTGWGIITYGGGKFVALSTSSNSTAAYSYDGQTWFEATTPTSSNWSHIAYGNGRFVAIVNGYKRGVYSNDGMNWYSMSLPAARSWQGVTYGDGKFIAVASSTNVAAYSTDGINWTEFNLPSSASWADVTYGNNAFVAIVEGTTTLAYSQPCYVSMLTDINDNPIHIHASNVPDLTSNATDSEWKQIYDSGAITSEVNSISGIDITGYKSLMVAVKCVNTTNTASTRAGAVIFNGNNQDYAFNNIFSNLLKSGTTTSGAMAKFKIVDSFIICETAMRAITADGILSDTEGAGFDTLAPVSSGLIKCTNALTTMTVSSAAQSATHFYGIGSRVIVWGCKV